MSALKEYYRSLPRRYDHILADVVNEIESTETKSSAVQRAYYFIYKAQSEEDDIYTLIVGNQIYTLYAHCSSLGVSAGQTVTQGQTIAAVGSTGDSTGNHLHFEVYVNNTRVAPEGWL